jgi:hypothetical protein
MNISKKCKVAFYFLFHCELNIHMIPTEEVQKLSAFNVAQGSEQLRYLHVVLLLTTYNAIKALLCNMQCFYGADSKIQPSNTHDMHCCFSSAIQVTTMYHNVVCTLSCSIFYMHIHLGIRISYLLTHTIHASYMKHVNTLQLDSHQHTIIDTIPIIHKLFLDKLKGMGKCRVFPICISLRFIYTFCTSSRILINGRSFYMQTK